MLTVRYGFDTDLKRSGHASCWCPPLNAIVQFGGWPPSDQLSRVIHEESSSCPLYVMPLSRVVSAMDKADQRRHRSGWMEGTQPARVCRLARLTAAVGGPAPHDLAALSEHDVARCSLCRLDAADSTRRPARCGLVTCTAPPNTAGAGRGLSVLGRVGLTDGVADEDSDVSDGRGGFIYAAGYHSDSPSTSFTADSSSSPNESSFSSSTQPATDVPLPAEDRGSAGAVVPANQARPLSALGVSVRRRAHTAHALSTERSDASYAPPALTRALLQQLDQNDTENARLRARLEEVLATANDESDVNGDQNSPASRTHPSGAFAHGERGRGVEERSDTSRRFGAVASSSAHTNTHRSTHAHSAFLLNEPTHREVPPILQDSCEVPGKHTVAPLRWRVLRPAVAPRTRHGHVLVYCARQLFLMGGSYWAHGNALASTDMTFDVKRRSWSQVNNLLPPRFCAAVAVSNARPPPSSTSPESVPAGEPVLTDAEWGVDPDAVVVYAFGGLNYSRTLTNTLHRLWLPDGALEELPQYGAQPRNQFKGILICDVQQERSPAERREGLSTVGRLFYMDGFQEGRPMAPALRCYNLSNGVWTRLNSSPDLTRGQLSFAQYIRSPVSKQAPATTSHTTEAVRAATYLARFDVLGGMPTRRGRQLRSRTEYSFDAAWQCYDFEHALPVPGLTAHSVTTLPVPPPAATAATSHRPTLQPPRAKPLAPCRNVFHALIVQRSVNPPDRQHATSAEAPADGVDNTTTTNTAPIGSHAQLDAQAVSALLCELVHEREVMAFCIGGNEDQKSGDQNNLGEPVGWLYCLGRRDISLAEYLRVSLDKQRVPYRSLLLKGEQRDELLDELF